MPRSKTKKVGIRWRQGACGGDGGGAQGEVRGGDEDESSTDIVGRWV